jgi:RimJ/RimL family protein N-acetyltransferase
LLLEFYNSTYAGGLNALKNRAISEKTDPETERSNRDFNYVGSDFDIISYREYLLNSGTAVVAPANGRSERISSAWSIYVLKSRVSDQRIGDCSLRLKQNDKFTAEMKVNISPAEQGKGYAKEAASTMISFLFNKSEVSRIVKIVDAQDEAAIALLKSLGFKEEAYFKDSVFSDGKWVNEYQFAMSKSDWGLSK